MPLPWNIYLILVAMLTHSCWRLSSEKSLFWFSSSDRPHCIASSCSTSTATGWERNNQYRNQCV